MEARLKRLICEIPKPEYHCHLESFVSPEVFLRLAKKNNVDIPATTVEEVEEQFFAVDYEDLDKFLDVWLTAMSVLQTEEDYSELVVECAKNAKEQNIIYREGMFTFQAAHGARGVALETVVNGFAKGREIAMEQYGVDIRFIAEIDRTSSSEDSVSFIHELAKFKDRLPIVAVGLDMAEIGFPASNHAEAYHIAKEYGFNRTAHAWEGGPEQIWDTIKGCDVQRIDHGSMAYEDEELVKYLVEHEMPMTICPDSDVSLGLHKWEKHPIRKLYDAGIKVTINSDDPCFLPMNLIENYERITELFNFTEDEIITMARNGFVYNFSGNEYLGQFDEWVKNWKNN